MDYVLYISNIKLDMYNLVFETINRGNKMEERKISEERESKGSKIKAILIAVLAVMVAGGLIVYAFVSGNLGYSIILAVVALVLLVFFVLFAMRRYKDASKGLPFEDERSKRVMEKAASKSFFVTLYVLLAIGLLSDDAINFRDVSQATGLAIGIMAVLLFAFWIYYNRKGI